MALPAHAKLNLELIVERVRPDGRHDIRTRFQAISLHDLLELEAAAETTLEVEGEAPAGEDNLVLRAARELEAAAGRPLPASIRLHKRIPAGAGLGGGSSDAAATLRGLSRLHGLELDLLPAAKRLGSDVPFFLCGGGAEATGAGDELQPRPAVSEWFAVAWPGYGVSTAAVYAAWDRVGGPDLTPAALDVEPRLKDFQARLGERWRMTGSGSAFFSRHLDRRGAEAAVAHLDCWTAVARGIGGWCP
ncbi:MAG TPA: 4-(cytidine 5'-diphospho)-2-C-methyl-D-erythritol kinase [Candidatus Dormibacteraeota bacterium]